MFKLLQKTLCLIAIFGLLDGHLAVFQGIAWVNMVQERAPSRGFSAAAASTFSGAEPCSLCCAIQEARQQGQEESPIPEGKSSLKYYSATSRGVKVFVPSAGRYLNRLSPIRGLAVIRAEAPSLPPPQGV